jgi:hypothetical protein
MASALPAADDRTLYPVEERVGEDILQRWIMELLRPLLERYLLERGDECFVGADQFIYYRQFDPHARVAPDIYVLPGVAPDTAVPSWKVWESAIVPSFALEVASSDWEKDYVQAPSHHAALGTAELVVFDPYFERRRDGVRFQRYTRRDRSFVMVDRTNDECVRSDVLGCLLCAVGSGPRLRLRLASMQAPHALFPTAEEAEREAREVERQAKEVERQAKEAERHAKEVERHAKEAERQAKEAERQAKEAERQAKDAALARIAELEAILKQRS